MRQPTARARHGTCLQQHPRQWLEADLCALVIDATANHRGCYSHRCAPHSGHWRRRLWHPHRAQ
eukprot:42872-Eustigmatos_ZCMA.PRE.1